MHSKILEEKGVPFSLPHKTAEGASSFIRLPAAAAAACCLASKPRQQKRLVRVSSSWEGHCDLRLASMSKAAAAAQRCPN